MSPYETSTFPEFIDFIADKEDPNQTGQIGKQATEVFILIFVQRSYYSTTGVNSHL